MKAAKCQFGNLKASDKDFLKRRDIFVPRQVNFGPSEIWSENSLTKPCVNAIASTPPNYVSNSKMKDITRMKGRYGNKGDPMNKFHFRGSTQMPDLPQLYSHRFRFARLNHETEYYSYSAENKDRGGA